MKNIKFLVTLSLILNLLFIGAGSFIIYKNGGINFLKNQVLAVSSTQEYSNYYLHKKDIFDSQHSENGDKIFVGDSITDYGEFHEYFSNEVILNRGISRDNSKGVLNRIDKVVKINAKEVYIMIGVNDILYGTDIIKFEEDVTKIVQSFDKTSTKVIIQSILPVNNEIYGEAVSNEEIIKFNKILKAITEKNSLTYLNLHEDFIDENGQLNNDYTIDGIHLIGKGYKVWVDAINAQ